MCTPSILGYPIFSDSVTACNCLLPFQRIMAPIAILPFLTYRPSVSHTHWSGKPTTVPEPASIEESAQAGIAATSQIKRPYSPQYYSEVHRSCDRKLEAQYKKELKTLRKGYEEKRWTQLWNLHKEFRTQYDQTFVDEYHALDVTTSDTVVRKNTRNKFSRLRYDLVEVYKANKELLPDSLEIEYEHEKQQLQDRYHELSKNLKREAKIKFHLEIFDKILVLEPPEETTPDQGSLNSGTEGAIVPDEQVEVVAQEPSEQVQASLDLGTEGAVLSDQQVVAEQTEQANPNIQQNTQHPQNGIEEIPPNTQEEQKLLSEVSLSEERFRSAPSVVSKTSKTSKTSSGAASKHSSSSARSKRSEQGSTQSNFRLQETPLLTKAPVNLAVASEESAGLVTLDPIPVKRNFWGKIIGVSSPFILLASCRTNVRIVRLLNKETSSPFYQLIHRTYTMQGQYSHSVSYSPQLHNISGRPPRPVAYFPTSLAQSPPALHFPTSLPHSEGARPVYNAFRTPDAPKYPGPPNRRPQSHIRERSITPTPVFSAASYLSPASPHQPPWNGASRNQYSPQSFNIAPDYYASRQLLTPAKLATEGSLPESMLQGKGKWQHAEPYPRSTRRIHGAERRMSGADANRDASRDDAIMEPVKNKIFLGIEKKGRELKRQISGEVRKLAGGSKRGNKDETSSRSFFPRMERKDTEKAVTVQGNGLEVQDSQNAPSRVRHHKVNDLAGVEEIPNMNKDASTSKKVRRRDETVTTGNTGKGADRQFSFETTSGADNNLPVSTQPRQAKDHYSSRFQRRSHNSFPNESSVQSQKVMPDTDSRKTPPSQTYQSADRKLNTQTLPHMKVLERIKSVKSPKLSPVVTVETPKDQASNIQIQSTATKDTRSLGINPNALSEAPSESDHTGQNQIVEGQELSCFTAKTPTPSALDFWAEADSTISSAHARSYDQYYTGASFWAEADKAVPLPP